MSSFEVSPIDAKVQKELYRKMIAVNRLDLSSAFNQENKTEQDGFQQQSSALDNASIFQPRDIMNDDTNPFEQQMARGVYCKISADVKDTDGDIMSLSSFVSGGPGGQAVNKIETAVRLRHNPSGIIIENSESASQLDNKKKALLLLKSQLHKLELEKRQAEKMKIESDKKKIEWGSQIRNYVLHPYKMIKDLRTNIETTNVQKVLDGDLDHFMKEYLMMRGQKNK